MGRVPTWLKVAYAVWMLVWVPVYWIHNGPANFLWMCDVANFVIGLGLWFESPLLISSQAAGVLLVQILWAVDYFGALLLGSHPIGGTEYMFDVESPLWLRGLSLFHLLVPPLLLWAVRRLGYDRRGWLLQTAIIWGVLPVSFFFADPARNLNWVWQPFGVEQGILPPLGYLAFLLVAYPLIIFFPSHLALRAWARRE
jgi:hypothetical protein